MSIAHRATLDLSTDTISVRLVRWMVTLADVLAAAGDTDRHTAMLQLADAYQRAADNGAYSPLLRASMLRAELRARRLADHLR